MIVVTFKYSETHGLGELRKSAQRCGHELAVIEVSGPSPNEINMKMLDFYKRASTGHENFLYCDSADSFIQREITGIPTDHILYSTEKACYPVVEYAGKHPISRSKWRFLNGGGVCGPIKLMIEYIEKYKLYSVGDRNGQQYLQECLFQALADGFPIKLDTECRIFQTLAFADDSEFEWKNGLLCNTATGTVPMVLHGNGLTEMRHIYKRFEETTV